MNNNMVGLICIIIGIVILVSGAPFLWHILLTLIALWLINYGLVLRGSPALIVWLQKIFDEIQSVFTSKK